MSNKKDYEIKNNKLNIKTIFKDEEDANGSNVLKSDSILYNKHALKTTFEDKQTKKEVKKK